MLDLALPPLGADPQVEYLVDGDVAVVFGPVRDRSAAFSEGQMAPVRRAVAKRRSEFSTGRWFALAAQRLLGRVPIFVEPAQSRRPIWPGGLVGSISHTDKLALVVLTASRRFAGLGVDIELEAKVSKSIAQMVLTPAETRALPSLGHLRSPEAVIFSAKEAIYKAVNPLVELMIGFEEVELDFDSAQPGSFTARYLGPNADNRLIETGRGSFDFYEDHVITTFAIPEPRAA